MTNNNKDNLKYTKGEILVLTSDKGQYYTLHGAYVVVKDLDVTEAITEFRQIFDLPDDHFDVFSYGMFKYWLVNEGYLDPSNARECNFLNKGNSKCVNRSFSFEKNNTND